MRRNIANGLTAAAVGLSIAVVAVVMDSSPASGADEAVPAQLDAGTFPDASSLPDAAFDAGLPDATIPAKP